MSNAKEINGYRPEYIRRAMGACKAEREGRWEDARSLWVKARDSVCNSKNQEYAEVRIAYCINAAARKWRSPHARG